MASVATFADVEGWLADNLAPGVPVGTKPPTPRPNSFVRIIRSGGPGRVNRISETATVIVESYAQTETLAQAIAQTCRNAIGEMQGLVIGGVLVKTVTEVSSPGNLPHPTITGSRYTQTFDLHLKGTP